VLSETNPNPPIDLMLSTVDMKQFKKLGIQLTSEANFENQKPFQ